MCMRGNMCLFVLLDKYHTHTESMHVSDVLRVLVDDICLLLPFIRRCFSKGVSDKECGRVSVYIFTIFAWKTKNIPDKDEFNVEFRWQFFCYSLVCAVAGVCVE